MLFGEKLRRRLFTAELTKPLRNQALLGEKAHEPNCESLLRSIYLVEVLLIHVLRELLRVCDLADGDLAARGTHDVLDLLCVYVRMLLLLVFDRLQKNWGDAV